MFLLFSLIIFMLSGFACYELHDHELLYWGQILIGFVVSLFITSFVYASIEIFMMRRSMGLNGSFVAMSKQIKMKSDIELRKTTIGSVFRMLGTWFLLLAISLTGFTPYFEGMSFYLGVSIPPLLVISLGIASIINYTRDINGAS